MWLCIRLHETDDLNGKRRFGEVAGTLERIRLGHLVRVESLKKFAPGGAGLIDLWPHVRFDPGMWLELHQPGLGGGRAWRGRAWGVKPE